MRIQFRRQAACAALALIAALGTSSCRSNRDRSGLPERIDQSLAAAARFMVSKQSADGAWRSGIYGVLKDGPSLTPPILKCLFFLPSPDDQTRAAFRRGVDYLKGDDNGKMPLGECSLAYPVYTAALASVVVGLDSQGEGAPGRAQRAWLDYLLRYRLGRHLGWSPSDPAFGGWGYATQIPWKPDRGESPYESNISATVFGIAALRYAKIPSHDPLYREILGLVMRCQNFSDESRAGDPRFDDGGFFFTPSDPARNKAGVAGIDRLGRERYNSYGSTTADGLRALLRCGLPPDSPRVRAAQRWLEIHFSTTSNPGNFARDREVLRDAMYYYYSWSVAHAFMGLGVWDLRTKDGTVRWAEALADELLRLQRADGSWANSFRDGKEDDPLVATPLAAAALTLCRQALMTAGPPTSAVSPQNGHRK